MELIPYNPKYKVFVRNYYLEDPFYTVIPETFIINSENNLSPVLCFKEAKLVCFFVLDNGLEKFNYSDSQNSILLRAFSTDSRFTKKGYATDVLYKLPNYVREKFPLVKKVYLGVNVNNKLALKLYMKVGFEDTGRLYEGQIGMQKVLKLTIMI